MTIGRSVGLEPSGATISVPGYMVVDRSGVYPSARGLRARITGVRTGVTVVGLAGDVDLATEQVLASALRDAVSATAGGRVVADLDRVGFLGACGLTCLLTAHDEARREGGELVLVADDVTPAAVSLRFLPAGEGPSVYRSLTTALSGRERP